MKSIKVVAILCLNLIALNLHSMTNVSSLKREADDEFLPADMLSPVGSENLSFSSRSSEASTLFGNKKKLLKMIRVYLINDKHESESDVVKRMKLLQKKSMAQITAEFEQDRGFDTRYRFIEYLKTFLIHYQHMPEEKANSEINKLSDLSIDQIYQKYYGWCQELTRNQMLEMIHQHIQFDQGFSGADADQDIAELSKLSLPIIRDRFMQYQTTFLVKNFKLPQSSIDRQQRLQQQYDQQKQSRSLFRKVPLVKNIEELLPSRITNWSDQQLFEKIAEKMKDIGFSKQDIDEEIDRLKKSSIADLQRDYPQLQGQLSKQLYYFDTAKHQGSDRVKSADFWLQQLHALGTTAVMFGSYAASATGYDPSLFDVVAGFALFDPRLTLATGQTKRELLDMIYAQYDSFDAMHDMYLNHEYVGDQLETKQELLEKISDCLTRLDINTDFRRQQIVKYQDMSKQELQDLYNELNYFALAKDTLKLSVFEKKILVETKSELLKFIQGELVRLRIPQDEINRTIDQLKQENIKYIRAARIDVHNAVTVKPIKLGIMPELVKSHEKMIRSAPKFLSTTVLDNAPGLVQNDWYQAGKSPAYIHLKMSALQDHVTRQPDGIFEKTTHVAINSYRAYSLLGLRHHIPGEIHSAAAGGLKDRVAY